MSNTYGPTTCILADDLTGAADSAVAFAARGLSTEVRLTLNFDRPTHSVLSINTATRDIPPEAAAQTIQTLAPHLDPFPIVFKKVDSVFRGNTFVEIAAAVRAFPNRLAIIAPSSPRHGRTCTDGRLHIQDLTTRTSTHLRAPFEAAGLTPRWIFASSNPRLLEASMRTAATPAVFCGAASDLDLRAIVRAALALNRPILWIGSSGLAHALAQHLHPTLQPAPPQLPPGPTIFVTGSDHPLTHAQLDHLRTANPEAHILRIERNQTPAAEIRDALAPAATLILNGGDTALHVCRALSIQSLHLLGEFAPGIPVATAIGGPHEGTHILLKSGGFGDLDLLSRIHQHHTQTEPQPV